MPLLFFGLVVLLIGSIHGQTTLKDFWALQDSRKTLLAVISKLERETSKLEGDIKKIKESPDYAWKVLKEKYHVVGKDEKIIFFAD